MKCTLIYTSAILLLAGCAATPAPDDSTRYTATMRAISAIGDGAERGTVTIEQTPDGVKFTPALTGLEPGAHGFHVHEKGSCAPALKDGKPSAGEAAGGHYDPDGSKKHGLPSGPGHRGDLPALVVDGAGGASQPVLAPRLKLADVKGRALMIHAGGDNHADHPAPLGGGGARMACGVIN